MAHPKIIVVGGGLAGLAATIKIAEMGGHVDLFSIVPVKRSHSVNRGLVLRRLGGLHRLDGLRRLAGLATDGEN